jgi:hypothetical protein
MKCRMCLDMLLVIPVKYAHLQAVGTMPPVKITGYGSAAPASNPSTSNLTSLKGPSPNVKPFGKSPRNLLGALKY